MASESRRGCGYRAIGGLYLCCAGITITCDRLPVPLKICPCCGQGIKFSRGVTWVTLADYIGEHDPCKDPKGCIICHPPKGERQLLLWVGEKFYSTKSFTGEASKMGISKRIASIPRGLELGKTWVLLAHKKAVPDRDEGEIPGIFHAFRPTHIEMPLWKSEIDALDPEVIKRLMEKGIKLIPIADGDPDHKDSGSRKFIDRLVEQIKKEKQNGKIHDYVGE